jgi:phage baseplate assembly protein W
MALKKITPGLSDKTFVTNKTKFNSDIDLSFNPKPGSLGSDNVQRGDIYKKTDAAAVTQSIENILLTNFNEKPFEPKFGSNLRSMLFELNDDFSESFISQIIKNSIALWEPRASVLSVKLYADEELIRTGSEFVVQNINNIISIKVEFLIRNLEGTFTASVNINRLR